MNTSTAIIILTLAILLSVGAAFFLILSRKRPLIMIVIILLLVFGLRLTMFHHVVPWAFDSLVGWEMSILLEIPGYTVTLIQQPHDDFYDSYFMIKKPDCKMARVTIDGDDNSW